MLKRLIECFFQWLLLLFIIFPEFLTLKDWDKISSNISVWKQFLDFYILTSLPSVQTLFIEGGWITLSAWLNWNKDYYCKYVKNIQSLKDYTKYKRLFWHFGSILNWIYHASVQISTEIFYYFDTHLLNLIFIYWNIISHPIRLF